VPVIVGLTGRVDPNDRVEAPTIGGHHDFARSSSRIETFNSFYIEGLPAGEAEGFRGLARLELQREHAHADQVRSVDALERLDKHRADAE
jgi:hypothetical protein